MSPDIARPFHAAANAIEWGTSSTERQCRDLISELRHPLAAEAIAGDAEAVRRALLDFLKAIVDAERERRSEAA
jgi:hypothetical protein